MADRLTFNNRPTFDYNGYPVRAAGVIIYTTKFGKTLRLLRIVNHKIEDIGGKTDAVDRTMFHTAARETCEETNGKLFSPYHTREECFNILLDLISNTAEMEYNKRCKYMLFKIHVHPNILKEDMRRFGLQEKTDWGVLKHYYKWFRYKPSHHKLHFRLRNLNF